MTIMTMPTRTTVERLSAEHPEFRYEITAQGVIEATVTRPKNQHGNLAGRIFAWLLARYGVDRVSLGAGVGVSLTDPEPYRQVDVALFYQAFDPDERYNRPGDVALVVEILSPSTEQIDRVGKFEEFAAVGIANYWIVDPERGTVTMWALTPHGYRQPGPEAAVAPLLASSPDDWLALRG